MESNSANKINEQFAKLNSLIEESGAIQRNVGHNFQYSLLFPNHTNSNFNFIKTITTNQKFLPSQFHALITHSIAKQGVTLLSQTKEECVQGDQTKSDIITHENA